MPNPPVKTDLTREDVLSLFTVDADLGELKWRCPRKNAIAKSGQAGCLIHTGYRIVKIGGSNYFVHRLIWLCVHGRWPEGDIDHINMLKADNRIANLRDVTRSVNKQNIRKALPNNASGLLGAHKFKDRWSAHINIGGRNKTIGYYDTALQAHEAYLAYKREHHTGNTL